MQRERSKGRINRIHFIVARFNLFDNRNLVFSAQPATEIDEFAAVGTEWEIAGLIVDRFGGLVFADGADHNNTGNAAKNAATPYSFGFLADLSAFAGSTFTLGSAAGFPSAAGFASFDAAASAGVPESALAEFL